MLNRRATLGLLASAATFVTSSAFAQKGNQKEKKAKKHLNGGQLVGAKIKENGRHKVGKAGKSDVEVEVKGGKVASLTAKHPQKGNLPVQKVKSKQKMAEAGPKVILAAADTDRIQLAQNSDWYYAYWFEEDDADYYYWFTADEVYVDSSWVEYYA